MDCTGDETWCGTSCVDTSNDDTNCGTCDNRCDIGGDQFCAAGECVCPDGLSDCDGDCVNLQVEEFHCGACGNDCSEMRGACIEGDCVCDGGDIMCDGQCVPSDEDQHCGGCTPCPADLTCEVDVCVQI